MTTVEKLYKNFGILADAKDKIGEHEAEYLEIIQAVKGTNNEKKLASQFISRFFKFFPKYADQAIDAQLDLCEDPETSIRRQAIKDLPSLCKDSEDSEQLSRIADVLAQLLQSEDPNEISTVHNSLMTLFKISPTGTLKGLFTQISSDEEAVRERSIKFIANKIKIWQSEGTIDKKAEELLLQEVKRALTEVNGDEYTLFMQILSSLKIMKLVSGHQQMIEIAMEQAELDRPFDMSDTEPLDRFLMCVRHALPYFSSLVPSIKFFDYILEKMFPVFDKIKDGDQLDVLKQLAELSKNIGNPEEIEKSVAAVFEKLIEFMPLPPVDMENVEEPKLEFSIVECLIYTFHQLARKHPEFLTGEENSERLKDFKIRLQYFARGIQGYIKKIRESLQGVKAEDLTTDENNIKIVALKTTTNINTLIKDLFYNPPSYKSNITLSWKPTAAATASTIATNVLSGQKRTDRTPITFGGDEESPSKKARGGDQQQQSNRKIYAPPSGKYSGKVGNYSPPMNRGGRGGQNRGFRNRRGRGRGQRWY